MLVWNQDISLLAKAITNYKVSAGVMTMDTVFRDRSGALVPLATVLDEECPQPVVGGGEGLGACQGPTAWLPAAPQAFLHRRPPWVQSICLRLCVRVPTARGGQAVSAEAKPLLWRPRPPPLGREGLALSSSAALPLTHTYTFCS